MTSETFVDRRAYTYAPKVRAPSFAAVRESTPQIIEEDGSETWLMRGANFVVATTRVIQGSQLLRRDQPDEYMLYLPPEVSADIVSGDQRITLQPDSLTIIPPGDSLILCGASGYAYRIFSRRAGDLAARSSNSAAYDRECDDVAPLIDWPPPPEGFKIRTYPLSTVRSGAVFGRIYRSTNLMVNLLDPFTSSRDQTALTPHSHDDFEQGTLAIAGSFEHYLRTPWGADRSNWKDDVVLSCDSQSLVVIPPGVIHTTAWFGSGGRIIDIFSPPREDFSQRPGWVRNAADYPTPSHLGDANDERSNHG